MLVPPPTSSTSPFFNESQLPSVKSGYYTIDQEKSIRSKTCRFLSEAGRTLKLPRLATSTAMVLFHRFYAVHSFQEHDRFEVALACILLAAKTEESPRKMNHVIQECHKLKYLSAKRALAERKDDNKDRNDKNEEDDNDGTLDVNSKEYIRLKERTLLLERVILHTIGFELSIDHPHKFIGEQVEKLVLSKQIELPQPPLPLTATLNTSTTNEPKPQTKIANLLVQNAISFANDSMYTCLCLQYPSYQIATAVIYMSAISNKLKLVNSHKNWMDIFHDCQLYSGSVGGYSETNDNSLTIESLVSIVKQILELIAERKGLDMSVFASIEADLKTMKTKQQERTSSSNNDDRGERDAKRSRTVQ